MRKLWRALATAAGVRRRRLRRLHRLRERLRIARVALDLKTRECELLAKQIEVIRERVDAELWAARLHGITDRGAAELIANTLAGR